MNPSLFRIKIMLVLFTVLCSIPIAYAQQTDVPGSAEDILPSTMWDKITSTGLTGLILILVSIIGAAYALERTFNLRRDKIVPNGLLESAQDLWAKQHYDKILEQQGDHHSTLGRIIKTLVKNKHCKTADLSMMAGDISSRELKIQMQRAYPLAVVATISPLLGLMGTVIGMIGAFDKVAAAGSLGDASLLGGDISKALITTGAGLTIAVPALVLYHYFKSRTSFFAIILEEDVGELLSSWYGARDDASEDVQEGSDEG